MTDEELLTSFFATKDRELFAVLYERMRQRLYALALRILRSPEDAEDITEDVFCKLYEVEPETIRSAESFLFRMVRNHAFNHRRDERSGIRDGMISLTLLKSRGRAFHTDDSWKRIDPTDAIEEPIDKTESVEKQMQKQELWTTTKSALDSLPPSQKEAIELYHGRGMTAAETAEILGADEAAIQKRVENGIKKLRKKLGVKIQPHTRSIRAVNAYTGEIVHQFPCVTDAMRAGFSSNRVYASLRRGRLYRGLKWSYANAT